MKILDRVILTILLTGAILRPTEVNWIWGVFIILVWLAWEGMILIEEYLIKNPVVVLEVKKDECE